MRFGLILAAVNRDTVYALNRRNERNVPYGVDRSGRVLGRTDLLMPFLPSAGFVIEF